MERFHSPDPDAAGAQGTGHKARHHDDDAQRQGHGTRGPGVADADLYGTALLEEREESPPTPAPWAIMVAVLALLAFGVLLGSLTGSAEQEAGQVLLAASPSQVAGSGSSASQPPAIPAAEEELQEGEEEPYAEEEGEAEEEAEEGGEEGESEAGEGSGGKSKSNGGGEGSKEAAGSGGSQSAASTSGLPPIKHVFLIVLAGEGFEAAFGTESKAHYLAKKLRGEGELLDNYFGVASGELANEIALISGQGPTSQTKADCPLYEDLAPGKEGPEGQYLGSGCIYPKGALTIGGQLEAAGKTWKAYVQGLGEGEAGERASSEGAPGEGVQSEGAPSAASGEGEAGEGAPAEGTSGEGEPGAGGSSGPGKGEPGECVHPAIGASDPNAAPSAATPYVTWRNPFAYFHSVIDSPSCAKDYAGISQLEGDLKSASSTPSLSYISPDVCDDGSEEPCAPGSPAGMAAADGFLRKVVPEIEKSPAYKEGGLIAITFDQAPQSGPHADSSGCCISPKYPNLTATTSSTTTAAGTASTSTTATTTSSLATATSTTSSSASATNASPASTTTSSSASATTSVSSSTPGPEGGGKVGLLLISKYVKPGSVEAVDTYNHYSLLLSIEELFKLRPLGYAGSVSLLGFGSAVYNASS